MSYELPSFITADHRRRLDWFDQHKNEVFPLDDLRLDADTLLAFKPKGIYKPKDWEHSLSIRINRDSPYDDRGVEWQPGGGWRLRYYQENADPADRDKAAGNRGLMRCIEDKVPVGVVRQAGHSGRRSRYEVLGLATPVDWSVGYFILESAAVDFRDAEQAARAEFDGETDFPVSGYDARFRTQQEIVRRQGQSAFRTALLDAYRGRCVVTACSAPYVLEAAHLHPYRGQATNRVDNGLLLRADIHTLLDLRLLAPHPGTRIVTISRQLAGTEYEEFAGRALAEPMTKAQSPAEQALQTVWEEFLQRERRL